MSLFDLLSSLLSLLAFPERERRRLALFLFRLLDSDLLLREPDEEDDEDDEDEPDEEEDESEDEEDSRRLSTEEADFW